jgi:hypothetical protein
VKKLPVVGTTAATTAFCSERIDGPEGTFLYVDGNGKITSRNGTLADPKPNAFSLVQVETCPGSTEACRSVCYVHNLETHQRATHDLYKHNTQEIRRILADRRLADWWAATLGDWIRRNAPGGFRWHVSGDLFSPEYANWIAMVCSEAPAVDFWIYTRSFGDEYLEALESVSTINLHAFGKWKRGNLAVNLSCDRDNYELAKAARERWAGEVCNDIDDDGGAIIDRRPTFRLCYLTLDGTVPADLPEDSVIFPDYALRPKAYPSLAESPWWGTLTADQRKMVCPVDAHGKAENRRCGPCDRCLT